MIEALLLAVKHLSAADLARLATTCTKLRKAVNLVIKSRRADASDGLDSIPVRVCGTQDRRDAYPDNYKYTRDNVLPHGTHLVVFGEGCSCCRPGRDACTAGCPCNMAEDGPQTVDGCLVALQDPANGGRVGRAVFECGPACGCAPHCPARVSQQGLRAAVLLKKDARKGWSAFAAQAIRRGAFVCQYAGEILSTADARRRLAEYDRLPDTAAGHALLVVREWLPSRQACLRVNIDATRTGNVARFFNHSCTGGNLELVLVRCAGSVLPHVGMYARCDIASGEELTFQYGEIREAGEGKRAGGRPCFCGAVNCPGFLPAEDV